MKVLRGTGCRWTVVKKKFVADNQYTGKYELMRMVDDTSRMVPVGMVHVDSLAKLEM